MVGQPDIVVRAPDGTLQLVVEVKARSGASAEWATQFRRNLLVHSLIPNAPYFLLALPDSFYLWRDGDRLNPEAPPEYQIDAAKVLAPYVKHDSLSLSDISEYGLEMLVLAWLTEVMSADLSSDTVGDELRWVIDSGLYEAIRQGSTATEALV